MADASRGSEHAKAMPISAALARAERERMREGRTGPITVKRFVKALGL